MAFLWLLKYLAIILAFLGVYFFISSLPSRGATNRPSIWQRLQLDLLLNLKQARDKSGTYWNERNLRKIEVIAAVAAGLLGFLLAGAAWQDPVTYLMVAVFGGAGFLFPRVIRAALRQQRLRALEMQLPDTLELISNSLRAGLSVIQALEVVAKEAARPMSEEFNEVVRDCRLGLSPEDALEKMLRRWPHKDLELFIVAASVSLRTGGNLAEVAGRIIETIRVRFRLRGRIASLTAQGKMSGWVVGLLPVVLLIGLTLLDPELMSAFFHHPVGIMMLAGGVLMELLGAFFIRQIVNIET